MGQTILFYDYLRQNNKIQLNSMAFLMRFHYISNHYLFTVSMQVTLLFETWLMKLDPHLTKAGFIYHITISGEIPCYIQPTLKCDTQYDFLLMQISINVYSSP